MKRSLPLIVSLIISAFSLTAQVTRINNNNSLHVAVPLNSSIAIVTSDIDSSIWITDASLPGTVQILTDIKYEGFGSVLSGKFIFRGSRPATGSEIYITDGTLAGTLLVKDIYPGTTSSSPGDFSLFNGFIYFSARTAAEGRELWRTNGTDAGTTILKDIVPGPDSSNRENLYHLSATPTYLLFAANTPADGVELWRSNGTDAGTVLVKNINTGADSSNPSVFYPYNNITLFIATDATHGEEIWRTDGTEGGTSLVRDINPGLGSATGFEFLPGFPPFTIFLGFHTFNNRVYFQANDGVSTGELWSTDGTETNTILLRNIIDGTSLSFVFVIDAVNLPNKFIFPVADGVGRAELWESDGTPGGTVLFKSFPPVEEADIPIIFVPYTGDYLTGTFNQGLFQGNKFFFIARTPTQGYELWISDGTAGGTSVVKDINPGIGNGIDFTSTDLTNVSYMYTTTELFFAANDGTHGNELWRSNGTDAGTSLVQDIYLNAGDAEPQLQLIFRNKIIFGATDGDNPDARDLFVVDGNFTPVPLKITDFTVSLRNNIDGLLQWTTAQELNTKNFSIQRSYDAQHFESIGIVPAAGTSNRNTYSFTDAGIATGGKNIVYYRLVASDKDGKSQNSNVISLKLRGGGPWNVHLLSNPVRDNLNIIVSGITGNVQFSVHDINGKTVFVKSLRNVNGQISLPVVLQKGVYILEVETNNERKSLKFVK